MSAASVHAATLEPGYLLVHFTGDSPDGEQIYFATSQDGAIPGGGCAWAPEAIFDDATGDYVVYWTTVTPLDGQVKPRIYYARTRDFRTFSAARLYIDRPAFLLLLQLFASYFRRDVHGIFSPETTFVPQAGTCVLGVVFWGLNDRNRRRKRKSR